MVWIISSCRVLPTRSLNESVGAAANGTASALSTEKLRSGIGERFQLHEEVPDFLPHFSSAREPTPVRSDQADQVVAFVDRRHIVFARTIQAIHQKSLN